MILLLSCLQPISGEEKVSESYEACVAVCEQKNTVGCDVVQSCDTSCQNLINQITEDCKDLSLALWTCQQDLTWSCSETGLAIPDTELCTEEEEEYLICIQPEDTAQ